MRRIAVLTATMFGVSGVTGADQIACSHPGAVRPLRHRVSISDGPWTIISFGRYDLENQF